MVIRLVSALLACVAFAAQGADRPHIVLFIADDYSWHDAGPYGATVVRTPNLDKLAKDGMRFDAAFAASPTCTPSRSAIYTGLYPFRNGAHANHSLVKDDVRSLPQYMAELGYRVVLAGKTHIGPRESFPFEYLPESNVMPPGKNHVLWTDLSTAAVEKLLAEHDRAKPLCLIVCSHSPHVYWPESQGYDPAWIKLPPNLVDTPETRAVMCKYYTDVTWMDRQVGEVEASLAKHGYAGDTLFVFTADQGAQWPFAKWNVYDAGIRVPLIVRWPGKVKPAEVAGSAAMVSLIDLLPTFVEAAGAAPPKDLDGRSFLGVLQGKTDRHRDEIFAAHTGDAQMNRSPMRCVRTARYKYILNLAPDTQYRTHIDAGVAADGKAYWESWERLAAKDLTAAKLVGRYLHRPAEELYELTSDPWEQQNLTADAGRAGVLAELRERVRAWRVQQGEDLNKVPMPEDARTGNIPYAK
jgi:arylsulfatase A-like enzyme